MKKQQRTKEERIGCTILSFFYVEDVMKKRDNFSGTLGFVMAAAGSAVGLGNMWRFPYLAAKDHGGVFLLCYIILTITFGFTLLTTEIAIGRRTGQSPLTAYGKINKKWGWIGTLACLVPILIFPYYCVIGGWVMKYVTVYVTGQRQQAVDNEYFASFLRQGSTPIVFMAIFLFITWFIVYRGVDKGIERFSKILMPILLVFVLFISVYSLTISYTDESGITRTGLDGAKFYLLPDFSTITVKSFFVTLMDAMGQLFFSISVAMGIMITYGSYVKKDTNLMSAINQIEIFDTFVAVLAGFMIVPAVYIFMGSEGMDAGPGLMFVSLPKVFHAMGKIGGWMGGIFFIMVVFAAITSSVSMMEAVVSSLIDRFRLSRKKSAAIVGGYAFIGAVVVCLGYNKLYFNVSLPNGTQGQILEVLDYISNYCLMPFVAFFTCILIGWVAGPKVIMEEICFGGYSFKRKKLYIVMIKYIAPFLLFLLLLQSLGL